MNFDLIIRNGQVAKGDPDAELESIDIAILQGDIVALGDLSQASAKEDIDASGKIVGLLIYMRFPSWDLLNSC